MILHRDGNERESRRVIESNVESCELRFEILINVKIYTGRRNELYLFLLFLLQHFINSYFKYMFTQKLFNVVVIYLFLPSPLFSAFCLTHTLLLQITWNISRAKKNTVKRGITVFFSTFFFLISLDFNANNFLFSRFLTFSLRLSEVSFKPKRTRFKMPLLNFYFAKIKQKRKANSTFISYLLLLF